MHRRDELHLASLLPLAFGLFGLHIVASTLQFRVYWSPLRGILVGSVLLVTSVLAVWQLWRGTARAPIALGMAGCCALGALLALDWLFPLINATTEPPSVLERLWYPLTLVLLTAVTAATVYRVRRLIAQAP
jgi:hypothetical protein